MRSRLRVVYWTYQCTPYVVTRFNAVAQRGSFEFEAWFDRLREADRSWAVDTSQWRFKARVLPSDRMGSGRLALPLAELHSCPADVIICSYDRVSHVLGALAARCVTRRTAVRCLPSFDAWTTPSRTRDLAKHFLFRTVDGAKVPGEDGAAYARQYGMPVERTWTVTQSIDTAHYAQARSISPVLRSRYRAELRLVGCVFIYVGRIWAGKGLDTLFRAYRQVRESNPGVSLLLVGDGPDRQRLEAEHKMLPGVVWAGFVQPAELPRFYGVADVMVFPTLGDPNGLVVEEAMSAALPVISTSAAGDIRVRLPDGVAGYIVPPADPGALAIRMSALAISQAQRVRMGNAGANIAGRFGAEAYADDFEKFIEGLLAVPRRAGLAPAAAHVLSRLILATDRGRRPPASLVSLDAL